MTGSVKLAQTNLPDSLVGDDLAQRALAEQLAHNNGCDPTSVRDVSVRRHYDHQLEQPSMWTLECVADQTG